MNISLETVNIIGMWLAQICYVSVYVPQIISNFKNKVGHGLSDYMLFGYFNGLIAFSYYVYFCNLPLVYRLVAPIQTTFVIILIMQRLFYDPNKDLLRPLRFLYFGNFILSILIYFLSLINSSSFGFYAGWAMFILALINQMPQVIKIYKEKSVAGFSIFFALLTMVAGVVEFLTAVAVGLPIQTQLSALRGVFFGMVWLVQFKIYRHA